MLIRTKTSLMNFDNIISVEADIKEQSIIFRFESGTITMATPDFLTAEKIIESIHLAYIEGVMIFDLRPEAEAM